MNKPRVSKSFLDALECVRDDISLVWNDMLDRYQVIHKDKYTGLEKIVRTYEDEKGNARAPDQRDIIDLGNNVAWDLLDIYRDPNEMADYFIKLDEKLNNDSRAKRREYIKWWNKDHKKQWRQAIENAQRGIFSEQQPDPERKIIVVGSPSED